VYSCRRRTPNDCPKDQLLLREKEGAVAKKGCLRGGKAGGAGRQGGLGGGLGIHGGHGVKRTTTPRRPQTGQLSAVIKAKAEHQGQLKRGV